MKKPITASDLMAKLEADPEYPSRRAEQKRKFAELDAIYSADEAGLVAELRELGYQVESVFDFVNNNNRYEFLRQFDGRYDRAYPVLVKHLGIKHHKRIREGIILALTEKEANTVASEALLREFDRETDHELRWVLANALRTVLTRSQKRRHPEYKAVYNKKAKP